MMIGAAMELVLAPTRPRSNSDSRIGKRGPLWVKLGSGGATTPLLLFSQ